MSPLCAPGSRRGPGESAPTEEPPPADLTRFDRIRYEGVPGSPGCPRPGGDYISVNLGRVIELDRTVRVKVAPEKRIPGRTFEEVMAAIPDSLAVSVDATVDAVIGTPCPEPPGSERCRVPDIDVYRYFLRQDPEGTYRVITRYLIGGA